MLYKIQNAVWWAVSTDRQKKQIFLSLLDAFVITACMYLAVQSQDVGPVSLSPLDYGLAIITIPIMSVFVFAKIGLYRAFLRFVSVHIASAIALGTLVSMAFFYLTLTYLDFPSPDQCALIYGLLLCIGIGGIRVGFVLIFRQVVSAASAPVVIFGAGEAGRQLFYALRGSQSYHVLLFIDDDKKLVKNTFHGVKITSFEMGAHLIKKRQIGTALVAVPTATPEQLDDIVERLASLSLKIRTVPALNDIISGKNQINDTQHISISDITDRDAVEPIPHLLAKCVKSKVVLITGAGGSIGSELCLQTLTQLPSKLLLLDVSEFALHKIELKLTALASKMGIETEITPLLGSILNKDWLTNTLRGQQIDTVFHSAAYKHVPMVEANVATGVENNVVGTLNLSTAAIAAGVSNFIFVSTDKAVRPTNVMGASKRLCELICQAHAKEQASTKFCIVRFGNVLGSSGSVIPIFEEQILSGGPLTVTHPEVTRYFMSVKEAAQLVIQAGAMARGGDVFILNMGEPKNILELAKKMIRMRGKVPYVIPTDQEVADGIAVLVTGLRPGEKIHEELLIGKDHTQTEHPKITRAMEAELGMKEVEEIIKKLTIAIKTSDLTEIKSVLRSSPLAYEPTER